MITDDDMDFTKPTAPAAPSSAPAPALPTASPASAASSSPVAPVATVRGKYYDPVVALKLFKAAGKPENVAAGDSFFAENEKSSKLGFLKGGPTVNKMYLLVSGEVSLTAGGRVVDTVQAGEIFGEMAVISQAPRTAAATARTACQAVSLEATQFQAALQQLPEFALMLMSVMFDRLRLVAARLGARKIAPGKEGGREAAVFDARTLAFLKEQLDQATIVRHPKGKVVMKEGESGANMYIVLEGRVDISIRNNVVELVGPGGTFGEMALVDQSPRTASAVTQEECVLLAISRSALIGLVRAQPAFGVALLRGVADRLRYMNSLLA